MISNAKTDRALSTDNGEAQTHTQGLEWRWRPLVGTRREAIWWSKSHQGAISSRSLFSERALPTVNFTLIRT